MQQPNIQKGSFSCLAGGVPLLDVFLVGPENESLLELLAPESISKTAHRSPIYLYGPSAVGKTSIAITVAARWLNESRDRTITMTSGTDFAKSFFRAIKADDMDRFRQLHRQCGCLLIDNVHELATKPAAQEELLLTIDHLIGMESAVVVTARELPALIPNLRNPLASRLISGHSVPIAFPSSMIRRELLQQLRLQNQLDASEAELDELAIQVPEGTSALQLKGILLRWLKHDRIDPNRSKPLSRRLIDRIMDSQTTQAPTIHLIAKAVAREMQVNLESLQNPGRKSRVVRARGLAMLLMRQLTDESYQNIGAYFGGKDHTTVMHACKKTELELAQDLVLARSADQIRQRLKGRG